MRVNDEICRINKSGVFPKILSSVYAKALIHSGCRESGFLSVLMMMLLLLAAFSLSPPLFFYLLFSLEGDGEIKKALAPSRCGSGENNFRFNHNKRGSVLVFIETDLEQQEIQMLSLLEIVFEEKVSSDA